MQSDAFNDWISIYNGEIQTVWKEEKTELRKVTMIYYAFEKELDRVKNILNDKLLSVKAELKKRECLERQKRFSGLAQSEKFDLDGLNFDVDKENETTEIVSLERFNTNEMKSEECYIESPSTDACVKEISQVPQTSKNGTANSPVLRKHSFNFKRKSVQSLSMDKPSFIVEMSGEDNRTPTIYNDSNIMECSIIDDTLDLEKERKAKRPRCRLKKPKKPNLNKSKQTSTLTQLFLQPQTPKSEMDSNLPSMTVTEMINLINQSDEETGAESDETVDLEVPTQPETNVEPQSKYVLKSYRSPGKKESPKFVYEEVVRGKARKKLTGWACRECQEYYEGLDLPPEELQKKKNQCSKHRHRFKPREDTYSGFWDLSFGPTPKTQEDEESLVFNYKKK